MEALLKPKAKVPSASRLVLSEDNGKILQDWIVQLKESCPGIRLKKQDLVNWMVGERGTQLSAADLKSIKERFFGEIELAQWALTQLKQAKARNEKITLAELIRSGKAVAADSFSKKKVPPSKKTELELPRNEAALSGFEIKGN